MDGFATGLSESIARDGQTTITADLPMVGFRHTGVGDASARNAYAAAGQAQDSAFLWGGTAGGTADALTITLTPVITAYAAGQAFQFISGASPNTGAATVDINGVGTAAIESEGVALVSGDITASALHEITYDGTAFQLSAAGVPVTLHGVQTITGAKTFSAAAVFNAPVTIRDIEAPGQIILDRADLSAVDAELVAQAIFRGRNDNAAPQVVDYGQINCTSADVSDGTEDGRLDFWTMAAGTLANRLLLALGMWTTNATGGDQGIDTINASNYYKDGVLLDRWVEIESGTMSAQESLDIFFTDTDFRVVEVTLSDVLAVFDTDELRCRTSTDGATFDIGANEYEFALTGLKSDGVDASTSGDSEASIRVAASLGSGSAETLSATIRILDPSTAKTKHIDINAKLQDSDGIWRTYVGGGMRDTEANVNGIQFFMPGGNIASGRYKVMGLRE